MLQLILFQQKQIFFAFRKKIKGTENPGQLKYFHYLFFVSWGKSICHPITEETYMSATFMTAVGPDYLGRSTFFSNPYKYSQLSKK
jgi:hypothetical protein